MSTVFQWSLLRAVMRHRQQIMTTATTEAPRPLSTHQMLLRRRMLRPRPSTRPLRPITPANTLR